MRSLSQSESTAASIRCVERACAVMAAFSLETPRRSLTELARQVRLPLPTAYRLATSLVRAGFMSQGEDGRYGLGFRLLELGTVVQRDLDLVRICEDAMAEVGRASGETVLLAKIDWSVPEVVIVSRRDSAHPLSILSPVGKRSPMAPTTLGMAGLSGLDEGELDSVIAGVELRAYTERTCTDPDQLRREILLARGNGFAVDRGEYLEGVSGVAVPVVFDGVRPLGSLGVVGPSSRLTEAALATVGALLLEATARLGQPGGARRA